MVSIEKIGERRYAITVEADSTTSHIVTLQPDDYRLLTGGKISPEELLRESFRFLLEREPNTSILREFNLTTIQRYFPEYRQEIQSRLGLD